MDRSFVDMERQARPFERGIQDSNGGNHVRKAIHLIYALASPCEVTGKCLLYLDDRGVNLVKSYIQPAARRGWLVILDDQLGKSLPVTEVRRIVAKGYLRYDNVAVALDPEFRVRSGQTTPGIPVGSVTSAEVNAAQAMLNHYAAARHPVHRKLLIVHEFHAGMIEARGLLRTNLKYVDTAVVADGFGTPGLKAHIYSDLLGYAVRRGVKWRGIKLFYPNPYEHGGHGDAPLLTWRQVFGHAPAIDSDHRRYFMRPPPSVVVIA